MSYSQRPRTRQKLSTLQRGALIAGGISIMAAAAYLTVVMNTANLSNSKAGIRLIDQDPVNNGEVILAFSWDEAPANKSDIGPSALEISENAECVDGGKDSTKGLSAGNAMKNIDMVIAPTDVFNGEGIDIGIDFRRLEKSGNFFTRGNDFNFGMKEGKICIRYKLTAPNGKSYVIDELSTYEIPEDGEFRNYRFVYSPVTGKSEVLVDQVTVWTNQGPPKSRIAWKSGDKILIGQHMNGEGKPLALFDNLIIRQTGQANKAPMDLLSFSAELQQKNVMLNWHTGKEYGTEFFIIEKSNDTKNYKEVGRVKGAGKSESLKAYALMDKEPTIGVTYYRLGLSNSTSKSVWVPVIAFRLKPEQMIPTPVSTKINNTSSSE
ncbi:MAG: hypothetical protein JNL88_12600 [Bacteroidia bacterium]|nr:hypothetical protein [Bacteroidia bacterium]